MSLGQTFSRIFGTGNTAPDVPVPQVPQGTQGGTVQVPTPTTPPASPMDNWKDLWQPTPASKDIDTTLPANMFAGTDPAKMLESARKVSFADQIPQEVLAKITAGGPEAAAAFMTALNDVGQRSYAQSSFATTKIVEAALAKFQEGIENRLPSAIKKHQVSDSIRQANPALQHPAAAPILEALQNQFTIKYPNATVNEIQDMAQRYLTQFSQLAAPPAPRTKEQQDADFDWDANFFSKS